MRATIAPEVRRLAQHTALVWACLFVIFAFGAWVRFTGLDWGTGYHFQPDEGTVIRFASMPGPLYSNPYEVGHYAYGGLPLYLYRFTAKLSARLSRNREWNEPWRMTLIGRFCAALSSTIAIALVYGLGRWAHGALAGLLAAALAACAVLSIQYVHYGVADTLMAFFVLLLAGASAGLLQTGRLLYYALVGATAGLAFSTKANGLLWLVLPAVAHFLLGWRRKQRGIHLVFYRPAALLVAGLMFLTAVWATSPYYILDFPSFWKAMRTANSKLISGRVDPTWTWQFIGTTPYLYPLYHLVRWSLGVPLGLLSIVGWIYALWSARRSDKIALLVIGPTVFFTIVGNWTAKFVRYLLPIIPFLCIYGGILTADIYHKVHLRWLHRAILGLASLVIVLSAAYALALVNVYRHTDTRIAASEWIAQHIPAGARILHDPEPQIVLPLGKAQDYDLHILDYYRSNRLQDLSYWVNSLQNAEYIVIVSRRNYATLMRLSDRYPLAACYYQSLFDGTLGYSLLAQFSSYPRLGPWEIQTDRAEETFQVFDHPRVMIFEQTSRPAQDLEAALNCVLDASVTAPRIAAVD